MRKDAGSKFQKTITKNQPEYEENHTHLIKKMAAFRCSLQGKCSAQLMLDSNGAVDKSISRYECWADEAWFGLSFFSISLFLDLLLRLRKGWASTVGYLGRNFKCWNLLYMEFSYKRIFVINWKNCNRVWFFEYLAKWSISWVTNDTMNQLVPL